MNKTITAVATALGGGIAIIRISGKNTFDIIGKIFKSNKFDINKIEHGTIKYGHIFDEEKVIDEVLVSFFKGPKSYTCEDVVEINCHGGTLVAKKILEVILKNGATLAEAGEFTKRAFLNGRIDLSQAEAVIEIITSKTENERKANFEQLEGNLSSKIKDVRKELIDIITDIQATIDYPEYDIPEVSRQKVNLKLKQVLLKLDKLRDTFFEGKLVKEGINIVIIGRPNVGKSSLLNVMAQKEKAIITDIPGTTRDIIEEYIQIAGIPVKLIDTAGLRKTNDIVESLGIEKTRNQIDVADLILVVIDGSNELKNEDIEILNKVDKNNSLIIINKSDLQQNVDIDKLKCYNDKIINISAKKENGIDKIQEYIKEIFETDKLFNEGQVIVTNVRHQEIIKRTYDEIIEIIDEVDKSLTLDIICVSLEIAINTLGEITGETASEDIIHNIFSKFCLGK